MDESLLQSAIRRQKFKVLLDARPDIQSKIDENHHTDALESIRRLTEETDLLSSEGKIREKAKNTGEVIMDLQAIKMAHELAATVMQKNVSTEFNESEFINNLKSFITDPGGCKIWEKIEDICAVQFRKARYSIPLLGTFEKDPVIVEKVSKQRAARQKNNIGEQKKPDQVNKLQQQEKGAQRLNSIMKILNKYYIDHGKNPIPYYKIICDPNDFMTTVDNAFQLSFLAGEGMIAIDLDEDNLPIVKPVKRSSSQSKSPDVVQAISTIDYNLWQNMIRKYQIMEPLLVINKDDSFNISQGPSQQ